MKNRDGGFILTALLAAALLAGPLAYAQETPSPDLNAEVDKIFSWATPSGRGVRWRLRRTGSRSSIARTARRTWSATCG